MSRIIGRAMVVLGCALIVGALANGLRGSSAVAIPQTGGCSELARAVAPANGFDTSYDPENNLLSVTSFNSSYTVNLNNDSRCVAASALVGHVVKDALNAFNEDMVGTCQSMRDDLAKGVTVVRGIKVNRAAGQAFVDRWCQGK